MFASLKKGLILALFLYIFTAFSTYYANAQTLQAGDIYYMAKNNNISGLWHYRKQIDIIDHNGNTAYCIALRKNEKNAAKFLEKLGANTKHECVSSISSENKAPISPKNESVVISESKTPTLYESKETVISGSKASAISDSETFLGMGKTGWSVIGGVLVAGGVGAAAGGGGGGGSSSSSNDTPDVPPALNCVNGNLVNNECECTIGWTGKTCETKVTCPYNTISCTGGYEETGNICTSGNTIYKECKAKTPPTGYTKESCSEGYDTVDTFLSGTTNYYKCEETDCSAYQTSCGEGYDATQSCLSGTTPYYTCTPKQVPDGYQQETCEEGYDTVDTFLSGTINYYKCEETDCSAYQTSCGEGYDATQSCLSGTTPYYTCTPKQVPDGYQQETCEEGYDTVDTFLSGTTNYYKCEEALCSGFEYANNCPTGYVSTGTCLSGLTTMHQCNDCDNGYVKQDNVCYVKLECGEGTQVGNDCVCNENAIKLGGICYTDLNCPQYSTQFANECVCDSGYIKQNDVCYKELICGNGQQAGDECICNEGYLFINKKCARVGKAGDINNDSIMIENTDNSDVYGLYSVDTNAYNAYTTSGNTSTGTISINNTGDGNIYGVYSANDDVYNAYIVELGKASGTINIKNSGDGNSYGMYGKNTYNQTDENLSSIIEMVNAGNGLSVGMYATDTAENSGDITIHNLADGTAVGIMVEDNGEVTNSGTITIDRESYTDTKGTEDTIDDETYIASTSKGGLAVGIYGGQNSSITNSADGKIVINDALNAYGIYAESGSIIINKGQIIIDGNSSHANAIKLNQGKLFQDGVLTVLCGNGYGLIDGKCQKIGKNEQYNNDFIVIENIDTSNVYGLYASTDIYNTFALNSSIETGKIDIVNNRDKEVYGIYSPADVYNSFADNLGTATGNINISNAGTADIYGLYSLSSSHNAYAKDKGTATGDINIENVGDGNIYGLYSSYYLSQIVYNATAQGSATATGNINIDNIGDGNIYGLYALSSAYYLSSVYNAYASDTGSNAESIINIFNTGNGNVYGLYAQASSSSSSEALTYNAYTSNFGETVGKVDITNIGNGNIYGLYANSLSSSTVYNAYLEGSGKASGTINIKNSGDGNSYGMYGKNTYNQTDENLSSVIEMVNAGNGLAVGMYATDTAENSGDITIHNLADGTAVGIIVEDNGEVTNSGTITIDRESYTDTKGTEDTEDDETYIAGTSKGGLAVGIYGGQNSTITNSADGKIIINGAENAYGIYAEDGSEIVNNGQIIIDGDAEHSNAILLNGGKLFQDGKLVVGSTSGCAEGYIKQNGICYQKLECGQGFQVANDCVCNENTVKQAGVCYTKLICPEHLVQVGNKCACNNGYIEQDGNCYAPLNCGMGNQVGNECVCNANTIKQDGVCYKELECGQGSQLKDKCVCNNGYIWQNGICYTSLNCGDGTQVANECVCNENMIKQDGVCYTKIDCGKGSQVGNKCICDSGYMLINGKCQRVGTDENANNDIITIENNDNSDVYGLYSSTDVYNANAQSLATATGIIDITNTGTGNVYGLHAVSIAYNATANVQSSGTATATGTVNITNDGNGNVYGLYSSSSAYNAYAYAYYYVPAEVTTKGFINISNTGDGNVYGLYASNYTNNAYADYFGYTAESIINIFNEGNGNVYGLYSSSSARNAYSLSAGSATNGSINIISEGNSKVYGIYSNADTYNAYASSYNSGTASAMGTIDIDNTGDGDTYGLYSLSSAYNAYASSYNTATARGTINITNNGLGSAYGIYASNSAYNTFEENSDSIITGTIMLKNIGKGNTYGMSADKVYSNNKKGINTTSVIEMVNAGNGLSVGMYATDTAENSGNITIHNLADGTAVGIMVEDNGEVTNSGTITIDRETFTDTKGTEDTEDDETYIAGTSKGGLAVGIYGGQNSSIINSADGKIIINGAENAYGIYAEDGSEIVNNGQIIIDGDAEHSNAILLNGGKLFQDGKLVVGSTFAINETSTPEQTSITTDKPSNPRAGSLNLNDFDGKVIASKTSQFIVEGSISGDLAINNNVVTDGFDTVYRVSDMIQAEDTSKLNLISQSAMFEASLENSTDAVMSMKSFNEVLENKSFAEFLEKNYRLKNNEKFFSNIKTIEKTAELNKNINKMFGKEMFSRFAFEDLMVIRELNFDINNTLFNSKEEYMSIGGNTTSFAFSGNSRYSLTSNNFGDYRVGLSIAFTDINSDDNNNENLRSDTMYNISMPIGYQIKGLKVISTPRIGYSYGTYDRNGLNDQSYEGTVKKQMFAIMNETRYPFEVGGWKISPSAELNFINYCITGYENDSEYSLKIKSQNNYSLEAGVGLYANKETEFTKDTSIKFNGGVAVYHEFADPYKMKVGMKGMSGNFTLRDEDRTENRAVVQSEVEFKHKNFTVAGNVSSYIDRKYETDATLDLRFDF